MYNYIACAYYRQYTFIRRDNWVRRRGGGFDENLTAKNREFLNQTVIETYSDANSPLKSGPWKKGEWSTTERLLHSFVSC